MMTQQPSRLDRAVEAAAKHKPRILHVGYGPMPEGAQKKPGMAMWQMTDTWEVNVMGYRGKSSQLIYGVVEGSPAHEAMEEHTRMAPTQAIDPTPEPVPQPLRVKEGGYYRRRDGVVVGPVERLRCNGMIPSYKFRYGGDIYTEEGLTSLYTNTIAEEDLVEEIPAPTPAIDPTPTFTPTPTPEPGCRASKVTFDGMVDALVERAEAKLLERMGCGGSMAEVKSGCPRQVVQPPPVEDEAGGPGLEDVLVPDAVPNHKPLSVEVRISEVDCRFVEDPQATEEENRRAWSEWVGEGRHMAGYHARVVDMTGARNEGPQQKVVRSPLFRRDCAPGERGVILRLLLKAVATAVSERGEGSHALEPTPCRWEEVGKKSEPFRIEAGKRYVTREGNLTGIMEPICGETFYRFNDGKFSYGENGRLYPDMEISRNDAVRIAPEPKPDRDHDRVPLGDLPTPPEGFAYYGVGPLRSHTPNDQEIEDVGLLVTGRVWKTGYIGDMPNCKYALRIGSEIAKRNGIGCGE